MSAFWTNCPRCGVRYFHTFVGTELLSGHACEVATSTGAQHTRPAGAKRP